MEAVWARAPSRLHQCRNELGLLCQPKLPGVAWFQLLLRPRLGNSAADGAAHNFHVGGLLMKEAHEHPILFPEKNQAGLEFHSFLLRNRAFIDTVVFGVWLATMGAHSIGIFCPMLLR